MLDRKPVLPLTISHLCGEVIRKEVPELCCWCPFCVSYRYRKVGNAVAIPVAKALGYALGIASQKLIGKEPLMTLPPKFAYSNRLWLVSMSLDGWASEIWLKGLKVNLMYALSDTSWNCLGGWLHAVILMNLLCAEWLTEHPFFTQPLFFLWFFIFFGGGGVHCFCNGTKLYIIYAPIGLSRILRPMIYCIASL